MTPSDEQIENFQKIVADMVEQYVAGDLHAISLIYLNDDGATTTLCGGCMECLEDLLSDLASEKLQDHITEMEGRTLQ